MNMTALRNVDVVCVYFCQPKQGGKVGGSSDVTKGNHSGCERWTRTSFHTAGVQVYSDIPRERIRCWQLIETSQNWNAERERRVFEKR